MSTRGYIGCAKTKRCVYNHFDSYPEAKLPELSALINRDGPEKVVETILSARTGGWSVISPDADTAGMENMLGERGRVVDGYGLAYTDLQTDEGEPAYIGDGMSENDLIWIEWVYLIDPETGEITYWNTYGDSPNFKTHNPKEEASA